MRISEFYCLLQSLTLPVDTHCRLPVALENASLAEGNKIFIFFDTKFIECHI
jgi:hypothetical protein